MDRVKEKPRSIGAFCFMGICIYNTDVNLIIIRIAYTINIMHKSMKRMGQRILQAPSMSASKLSDILSISLSQKFLISVTGICSISFRDKVF